jgi:hypothetical protein
MLQTEMKTSNAQPNLFGPHTHTHTQRTLNYSTKQHDDNKTIIYVHIQVQILLSLRT